MVTNGRIIIAAIIVTTIAIIGISTIMASMLFIDGCHIIYSHKN